MKNASQDTDSCRSLATGMWVTCAVWWYFSVGGAWLDLRGAEVIWAWVAIPLMWMTVRWLARIGRPLSNLAFFIGMTIWVGSFVLWLAYLHSALARDGVAVKSALLWAPGYLVPLIIALWMAARSGGWIGQRPSAP